ncbi:hypothetical protein GC163_03065 [bacterium]|nr:hypothetical protein [bacterium]
MLWAGCQSRSAPPANSDSPSSGTAQGEEQTDQGLAEIEDQLRSALYQLQPENLNIDSRLDDAVSVLNNWFVAAKASEMIPAATSVAAIPADRVPPELLAELEGDIFDGGDGRHIRAAFFAQKIAESVTAGADSDFDRMMAVFNWGCRNLALNSFDQPELPFTFYEALIVGRMRPEDRAMVLAGLFRQMRIDCVVLRPTSEVVEDQPWLFGVIVDGQVYLFDLDLGLPVPAGEPPAAQLNQKPATLVQLKEHPEWLSLLSPQADQPYAMTAEQVANLHVDVITPLRSWTQRMWSMEQLLPGEMLCQLYDPPSATADRPSLFDRVAQAFPGITADQIGVWSDPIRSEARMATLDANGLRAYQSALIPFIVPVEYEHDRETGTQRRIETQRHLRIRTEQLLGNRIDAVSQYVTIRQLSFTQAPEPPLQPAYARAADDAFFWSIVCKYELGETETAISQLQEYLKRYRRGGQWVYPARALLADAYHTAGNTAEFEKIISVQDSDDPYRDRFAVLSRSLMPAKAE